MLLSALPERLAAFSALEKLLPWPAFWQGVRLRLAFCLMFMPRHTMVVEKMYHQLGGSITVIMKEGVAHHPHSLIDPTPIADWIESRAV